MPASKEVPSLGKNGAGRRPDEASHLHKIWIGEGCWIVRIALGNQDAAEIAKDDARERRDSVRVHDFAAVVAAAFTASAFDSSALPLASIEAA